MRSPSSSTTTATTPPAAGPRRIEDLPGPRGWPLIGSIASVRRVRVHQAMEAWSRRYGPLFRVKLGATQLLVVSDHELIGELLRERPDGFSRSSQLRRVGQELGGIPGLFSAEGEAWRRQRRMVMASFAPGHVRAYFPALQQVALRLRRRWQRAAAAGAAIDLQADLKRYAVDIIAGLAFGSEVNTLEAGEDVIQRHLDTVLATIFRRVMTPIPYWRWFKLPDDRRAERSMAALREAITDFIAQARERLRSDPARREQPRNLLEAMLVAAEQGDAGVSDRDVAGNVSTMLFAGEDTTSNTLAWLIWLLHRHPDALQRAREEVQRVVPDLASATFEQINALDYVDACASEAMRLKPVAPFLGLEALRDTTVAGVQVPQGTLLWCVLRHDSVDERWFPQADRFDPARWLAASDGEAAATALPGKRVAMPFGGGPRVCPGRYLALLEIKLAMATLLGSFDIESLATGDGREMQEHMTFTMNPSELHLRLRVREAALA